MQKSRELDISPVASPSEHLAGAVMTNWAGPDHGVLWQSPFLDQPLVARCPTGERFDAELAFFNTRHQFASSSAACWTARTILS